jgi:hypothetical protein
MFAQRFYSLRDLVVADGFQAVWAFDTKDGVVVERTPLAYVAVEEAKELQNGQWIDVYWDLVGIQLRGGAFDVVTDSPRCHGIVRDSATHEDCLDLLPDELRARAVESAGSSLK